MREKAVVVKTKNDRAQIEIIKSSACNACRGCSAGRGGKPIRVWAKNSLGANVGQLVEVEINASTFLSATMIVYGIPLIAFLIGIIAGYKLSAPLNITWIEPFALVLGIVTMLISFLCIHFITTREKIGSRYTSRIVKIAK